MTSSSDSYPACSDDIVYGFQVIGICFPIFIHHIFQRIAYLENNVVLAFCPGNAVAMASLILVNLSVHRVGCPLSLEPVHTIVSIIIANKIKPAKTMSSLS